MTDLGDAELPKGWAWARLDEIAEVRLGRQRSPKNHTGDQMRPYLRAANVGWNGLKLDDVKEMNFTDVEVETYRLLPGDIVLSEASGSVSEVGKPALWNGQISDCCFQNTLIRARPAVGIESRYLLHLLRYEAIRGSFAKRSRGVGIHHLGSANLSAWQIPLPPFAEQHRIADTLEGHLSRLDVAVSTLDHARALSVPLRRSALAKLRDRAAIAGAPITPLGALARTSLGKMLDSKKNSGNPVPYLRNINVRWGSFDLDDVSTVPMSTEEAMKFGLEAGDLLVCEGGEPGRCAIWPGSKTLMTFQKALHRIRPQKESISSWLALMLEESARNGRTDHMLTGTTIKHLPQEKLRQLEIPIPSLSVQLELVEEFTFAEVRMKRLQDAILAAITRARHLRIALLERAFAGKLVAQDSADEPASALLDRIRAERAAQLATTKRVIRRPRKAAMIGGMPPPPASSTPASVFAVQQELPL